MSASLNITKIGVKSDNIFFPGVSLLRIPEYFKQIPSEALAHKLLKLYNVLLRKISIVSLDFGVTLKPQETA